MLKLNFCLDQALIRHVNTAGFPPVLSITLATSTARPLAIRCMSIIVLYCFERFRFRPFAPKINRWFVTWWSPSSKKRLLEVTFILAIPCKSRAFKITCQSSHNGLCGSPWLPAPREPWAVALWEKQWENHGAAHCTNCSWEAIRHNSPGSTRKEPLFLMKKQLGKIASWFCMVLLVCHSCFLECYGHVGRIDLHFDNFQVSTSPPFCTLAEIVPTEWSNSFLSGLNMDRSDRWWMMMLEKMLVPHFPAWFCLHSYWLWDVVTHSHWALSLVLFCHFISAWPELTWARRFVECKSNWVIAGPNWQKRKDLDGNQTKRSHIYILIDMPII